MAIDYIIDYECVPKQTLTANGILQRLKGLERAEAIIALYRKAGDNRPPSAMGFEFTRSTPGGEDEKRVVIVQDLLDAGEELKPLEGHCAGCPANLTGKRFGCTGYVQYPISVRGEAWLLNRLPVPDEALVWLLLRQSIDEFHYDGSSVAPMRTTGGIYFEMEGTMSRRLGEFKVSGDQTMEMLFLLGHIQPTHAAVLLLFFGAIERDLRADEIMALTQMPIEARARYPFRHDAAPDDDVTTRELKTFFAALYLAWRLNVRLLLDV